MPLADRTVESLAKLIVVVNVIRHLLAVVVTEMLPVARQPVVVGLPVLHTQAVLANNK